MVLVYIIYSTCFVVPSYRSKFFLNLLAVSVAAFSGAIARNGFYPRRSVSLRSQPACLDLATWHKQLNSPRFENDNWF
jgi:hypothetical protein